MIITGIPGAGKSTFVAKNIALNIDELKFVFEGALNDYERAKNKLDMCIKVGLEVSVFIFHRSPEKALDNTYKRFEQYGRGAYIETMANIQGGLAETIPRLIKEYGTQIQFCSIDLDKIDAMNDKGKIRLDESCQEDVIPIITKECKKDDIEQRLAEKLKKDFREGTINERCLHQASGSRFLEFANARKNGNRAQDGFQRNERSRNAKACSTDSMVNPKEEHISQLVLPIDISFLPVLNTLNALDAYVTEYEAKAEAC